MVCKIFHTFRQFTDKQMNFTRLPGNFRDLSLKCLQAFEIVHPLQNLKSKKYKDQKEYVAKVCKETIIQKNFD